MSAEHTHTHTSQLLHISTRFMDVEDIAVAPTHDRKQCRLTCAEPDPLSLASCNKSKTVQCLCLYHLCMGAETTKG